VDGGGTVRASIRGSSDLLAGLLFIGFGAAAVYLARGYPLGSAMRMGPGYFPTLLGGLLTLLGTALLIRGLAQQRRSISSFSLGPVFLVLLSVALFAWSVDRLGIVLAVVLVVLVSSVASGRLRWTEVLLLACVMASLAVGLFTKALGLPFRVLPF
jgi:mannose/fructose/N-acetylgalactosamine-specific phosphotransferase system component IIC